eukprot:GHVP01070183.1.p1 GENE.GHVP01070183.1~~GHVP01070183.1.p1  ORF type:complete len:270 (+),score=59.40 GHVP01070183.1:1079-1888(+)
MYIHEGRREGGSDAKTILEATANSSQNPRGGGFPGAPAPELSNFTVDYDVIIVGYVGSEDYLKETLQFLEKIKVSNKNVVITIDPVLGDNGRLYTSESLVKIYRESALNIADLITPNQFELQWLLGKDSPFLDLDEVKKACLSLVENALEAVVVTSVSLPSSPNKLYLFGCLKNKGTFVIEFDKKEVYYGGCGDLMTALLAHDLETRKKVKNVSIRDLSLLDFEAACQSSLFTVQKVLDANLKSDSILPIEKRNVDLDVVTHQELFEYC